MSDEPTRPFPGPTRPFPGPTAAPRPELEVSVERYVPLDRLGAGGQAEVTRCFDRALQRPVAAKRPRETKAVAALAEEARLLAYLEHPGVVPVYDLCREPSPGYTMKVLRGESLKQRLDRLREEDRFLGVAEAVRIGSRVAETMASAHSKGVAHPPT